jgi:hypothetical protein
MQKQYGAKKGEEVFYASENKGTITGVAENKPRHIVKTKKKKKAKR